MLSEIKAQAQLAVNELIDIAALKQGDVLVVGCSSSEVMGEHIGKGSSMDAAKAMGEEIGNISNLNRDKTVITVSLSRKNISLNNGDGFSFVAKDGDVTGFRGDVCEGSTIRCKSVQSAYIGARLYRNINAAFEKEIDRQGCKREITVTVSMIFQNIDRRWTLHATATSEDGRKISKEEGILI